MGYTTDFTGKFKLDKKLSESDYEFLMKFSETRHRGESEFESTPGIWCGWVPSEDGTSIVWNEQEKFYHYNSWIKWLITNYLGPRGYMLNGTVNWYGEESDDIGRIVIADNVVDYDVAQLTYEDVPALLKENEELKNTVAEMILLTKEAEWGR